MIWDIVINAYTVITSSQWTASVCLVLVAAAFTLSTLVTMETSSPPIDRSVVDRCEGAVVGENCWERPWLVSMGNFKDRVDIKVVLVVEMLLDDLFLTVFLFGQPMAFAVAAHLGHRAWCADRTAACWGTAIWSGGRWAGWRISSFVLELHYVLTLKMLQLFFTKTFLDNWSTYDKSGFPILGVWL